MTFLWTLPFSAPPLKWTPPKQGCIEKYDIGNGFLNISDIKVCHTLCEEAGEIACLSVEYSSDTKRCVLNRIDTSMVDITSLCEDPTSQYSEPIKGKICNKS